MASAWSDNITEESGQCVVYIYFSIRRSIHLNESRRESTYSMCRVPYEDLLYRCNAMFSIGALACAVSGGGSRRRKRGEVLFHLYRESDWQRQYTYLHNINDVDVAALSPSTSGQFNACARWNVIDCKIAMNKSLQSFHLNSLTHTLLRQLRMLLFFFYYYYFVLFHLLFAYLSRISIDSVGRGIALPLTDVCLALLLGKVIKFFKCNSVYWQLQQWWMLNEQYQGADAMAVHRQSRADRSTKELNAIMRVHICYNMYKK